jgi:hypothetical protein
MVFATFSERYAPARYIIILSVPGCSGPETRRQVSTV